MLFILTAPLIKKDDLIKSYKNFQTNKFKFIFSASKFSYPVQRSFYLNKMGIKMVNKKNYSKRSQDLKDLFFT